VRAVPLRRQHSWWHRVFDFAVLPDFDFETEGDLLMSAPPGTESVRGSLQIKYLRPGELMGRKRGNILIAVCNALLKGTITHSRSASSFMWTDNKLLLNISNVGAAGGTGGMNYRGEFSNTAHGSDPLGPGYAPGDVVTVSLGNSVFVPIVGDSPQNARCGTYVCVRENSPLTDSTIAIPVWPQYPHPPVENRFWELIGGLNHYRGFYQADPHTAAASGALGDIMDMGFGAPDYVVGDMVVVSPISDFASASAIPGIYICIQDAPGPAQAPVYPLLPVGPFDFGRAFWQLLSTAPSASNICNSDGSTSATYVDEQPQSPPFA
jgi:hypothetical protein